MVFVRVFDSVYSELPGLLLHNCPNPLHRLRDIYRQNSVPNHPIMASDPLGDYIRLISIVHNNFMNTYCYFLVLADKMRSLDVDQSGLPSIIRKKLRQLFDQKRL